MELRELIERAAAGEIQAWETLVERFSPLVSRILGKFESLSEEEKEDLSQEVWSGLLDGGLQAFRGPTDGGSTEHVFRSYLATITKREAISYLLRHGRPLEVLVPFLWGEEDEAGSLWSFRANPSLEPENQAAWKERVCGLLRCLQTLPRTDQEIFWMEVRGWSHKEIMQELGLLSGTVAVKYHRAKKKIKECLRKAEIL